MAREFARTRLSIWDYDAWLDLTPGEQHLYSVLSTDPGMNYAGRVDWRPARLTTRARGWTEEAIRIAAAGLESAEWALFDEQTEEGLVRRYIGDDELLRNPKLAIAVANAYGAIASRRLRAAVVSEIRRVRKENPDYSSWTHRISEKHLDRLLNLPGLDQYEIANPITNRISNPITNRNTNEIGNHKANDITNGFGDPDRSGTVIPTPDPITNQNTIRNTNPDRSGTYLQLQQQHIGGHLTGVRHQGAPLASSEPTPEDLSGLSGDERIARIARVAGERLGDRPSPYCSTHPGGTSDRCRACQTARERRDRWDVENRKVQNQIASMRRALIAECDLCDDAGWRIPPVELGDPPAAKCSHGDALPSSWAALMADTEPASEETDPNA
jgi:hypothetical protein